jgi:hypothetical protein
MLYGDNNLVSLDLGTDASILGLASKTRGENGFVGENDKSTSSSELSLDSKAEISPFNIPSSIS